MGSMWKLGLLSLLLLQTATAPPGGGGGGGGGAATATAAQQAALVALYDATGGPTWTTKTWDTQGGSNACDWDGVSCRSGAIIGVELEANGSLPDLNLRIDEG